MTGITILVAVTALLFIPVVASRWHLEPLRITRAAILSLSLAFLIVASTLAMCAAALLEGVRRPASAQGGFSPRHLFPGAPTAGWASLAIISVMLARGLWLLIASHRGRRRIRQQLTYADPFDIDDVPVVALPTEDFFAAAVPGADGCVLMSQGALHRLDEPEIRAIVHHEDAHRRLGHHRHMLVANAANRTMWFLPGIRRATQALRASLERAADVDACNNTNEASLRSALRSTAAPHDLSAVARLDDLDIVDLHSIRTIPLFLGVGAISAIAIATEMSWLGLIPT